MDIEGEVANQDLHLPIALPKLPGRFYYYFGKPIETACIYIERELEYKEGFSHFIKKKGYPI